jgi:hypothetical protein
METPTELWNSLTSYTQAGFHEINAIQGLLIAIIAALMLHRWAGVFAIAVGATLTHLFVDVLLPVLSDGAPFRLPNLVEVAYWRYALTLYLGYIVVISVFYILKRGLLGAERQIVPDA